MTADERKQRAAVAALEYVEDGMVLGLGTGSTAAHFVRGLAGRVQSGLQVTCAPTSVATETLAKELGVPLVDPNSVSGFDLTVDGADEADSALRLIKGGGGALLREKIIAAASERMIVIADDSKLVDVLGGFPLPVEVTPFAWRASAQQLDDLIADITGGDPNVQLRETSDGQPFLSDGGNYILDCACGPLADPDELSQECNLIPGVIENGLFVGLCDLLILGVSDGVRVITEPDGLGDAP